MSSAMPTGMGMDSSSMTMASSSPTAMATSMISSMMTSASSMMSSMSTGTPTSMMSGMSGTAVAASSATSMNMSGMSMGGMSDGTCQINMLWNWYTIDACFLAEGWQIQTNAQFAGTCIGVILITMTLPLLRKVHAAYDAYVSRDASARIARYAASGAGPVEAQTPTSDSETDAKTGAVVGVRGLSARMSAFQASGGMARTPGKARPLVWQQAVRALLHAIQFGVAYLVMLLAMYYNGYILISIFIGAFLGFFVFEYEITCKTMSPGQTEDEIHDVTAITGCCG